MLIIIFGISFSLYGCGTVGKNFNTSKATYITNGVTTQKEVKSMLGKPFKTGIQNGQSIWVYEHNHYSFIKENTSKDLIIVFDANGIVKSHQFMTSEPTP